MLSQIPLQFDFHTTQTFDKYHPGSNAEAIQNLKSCALGQGSDYIFLSGESGMGKSHLLQASCEIAHRHQFQSAYFPLKELGKYDPSILDGLDRLDLVCIDDLQTIEGNDAWEQSMFHFFNRIRENGNRLIISARIAPNQIKLSLPDLKSRLCWGLTVNLKSLTDEDKTAALRLRAATLGFELSPRVGRYLLARYPRDLPSLWKLLDRLDQGTLAAKRRLTIPFVKQFLNGNLG